VVKGFQLDSILDIEMGMLFSEMSNQKRIISKQKSNELGSKSVKFLRSLGFKVFKNGDASNRGWSHVR